MTAPLLVFGWGNLSRGDDALGPLFVEQLRASLDGAGEGTVDFLDDYQLQVEHALDLVGREHVLFVDASLTCAVPYEVTRLRAERDPSYTTHAVSPASVMHVFQTLQRAQPPACTLLAIRGARFELGEPPQSAALAHLAAALAWGQHWVHTCAQRLRGAADTRGDRS